MSRVRVAINGFGRIGRIMFRANQDQLDIVGINSLGDPAMFAHLLKYDSTHGVYKADVKSDEKNIIVNGKKIPVTSIKDPTQVPWKNWEVDMVLECSGAFKKKEDFQKFIDSGCKKVLVSNPAEGADLTAVYGVNHELYDPKTHHVVSNASCTTNCLAPTAKVLHETFGIEQGLMTTIHAYTNDQRVLDMEHKDLRRARAAGMSMIPTTTGAAKAVGKVIPALKGKIDGFAVRVPTANVSMVDFTFISSKPVTKDAINQALIQASKGALKGVLATEEAPLVSIDFNGTMVSGTVDLQSTMVIGEKMAKVIIWYDNEMGYSRRMIDIAQHMINKGI